MRAILLEGFQILCDNKLTFDGCFILARNVRCHHPGYKNRNFQNFPDLCSQPLQMERRVSVFGWKRDRTKYDLDWERSREDSWEGVKARKEEKRRRNPCLNGKARTKYDNCVKEREVTVPNNLIHTSLIWRPGETEKLTLSLPKSYNTCL